MEDTCFFLSTCSLLNLCPYNSSTHLVTKILSGLLLSVTLSLFTLTELSYFLSPRQVTVHVRCLWHILSSQEQWLSSRGIKVEHRECYNSGYSVAVAHYIQSLLQTSVARVRVFKMCCTVICLYWQEVDVSDHTFLKPTKCTSYLLYNTIFYSKISPTFYLLKF
jgi:hypothetical protein